METKYTAFLTLGAMLLYATVFGLLGLGTWRERWRGFRLALVAVAVAAALFTFVELAIAARYGESHFLHEYRAHDHDLLQQLTSWSVPLLVLTGGVGSTLILLGFAALGFSRRSILIAGAIVALGYAVVGSTEATLHIPLPPNLQYLAPGAESLSPGEVI